jgi:probable DNA metabolism protein
MMLVVYDGSFEGFLSAVFDIYEYKFSDVTFATEDNYQKNIFDSVHETNTTAEKTKRVYKGLEQRLSKNALSQLYKTFLSEIKNIENVLLQYIRYAFTSRTVMEYDYSNAAVLTVQQTSRIVHREKHRMEAFVRFQLTADELYYAVIEPDFNVLPLIKKHFHNRYADQCWMIYDTRRKYGLYYDKETVVSISMTFGDETASGKNIRSIYNEKEELYQKLWRQYFRSVNIAARKNMKLHIQHLPKRYWRYLTEKF